MACGCVLAWQVRWHVEETKITLGKKREDQMLRMHGRKKTMQEGVCHAAGLCSQGPCVGEAHDAGRVREQTGKGQWLLGLPSPGLAAYWAKGPYWVQNNKPELGLRLSFTLGQDGP